MSSEKVRLFHLCRFAEYQACGTIWDEQGFLARVKKSPAMENMTGLM
jgi:hypothetical protein